MRKLIISLMVWLRIPSLGLQQSYGEGKSVILHRFWPSLIDSLVHHRYTAIVMICTLFFWGYLLSRRFASETVQTSNEIEFFFWLQLCAPLRTIWIIIGSQDHSMALYPIAYNHLSLHNYKYHPKIPEAHRNILLCSSFKVGTSAKSGLFSKQNLLRHRFWLSMMRPKSGLISKPEGYSNINKLTLSLFRQYHRYSKTNMLQLMRNIIHLPCLYLLILTTSQPHPFQAVFLGFHPNTYK